MKSSVNCLVASLLLILCAVSSYGQKFDRYKDRVNECSVIKYFNSDFQIIVDKVTPFDSTQATYFRIGLYVIKVNVPIDLFMKSGVTISFVDGSKIRIKDQISWLYFGNDSYQLFVKHRLEASELELLCAQKIDNFTVIDYTKELDKWQSADFLKAVQKLQIEK
jgi:hypothetical protein